MWNPTDQSTNRLWRRFPKILVGLAVASLLTTSIALARTSSAPSGAPTYGGTITFRENTVPYCLDGEKTSGPDYADFAALDTLITSDAKGKYVPDLATKWKASHGGKWVTFTLRKGVKFSNGDPLTASAVKYTYDRVLKPGFSAGSLSLLGPLKSVKVINNYTVRFIMSQPFRPIYYAVQFTEFGILDPKADKGRNICTKGPIGTGAYKIQSVGPGFNTITMVRNPYHNWEPPIGGNTGKPYVSKVVEKPITSDATAVSSFLSGSVNLTDVPGTQLGRVQGNSKYSLHKLLNQDLFFLGFNMSHKPFNKPAVRKAVAQIVDRANIISAAFNGLAKPAYSTLAQNIPFYDKNAKKYLPAYNPVAAKATFAKYGVTGPYTMLVFSYSASPTIAEVLQSEFQAAGVKVNLVNDDPGTFVSVARKGNFDMDLFAYGDGDASIYNFEWASSQESSTGYNFSFYKNRALDKLITEGGTALSTKKARSIYAKIQILMNRDVVVVPIATDYTVYATPKTIKGWNTSFGGVPVFQDLYFTK